jgi:phospholipase/carboxylesterase
MELDASAVIWNRDDHEGLPRLLLLHGYGSHEGDLAGLAPHLPAGWALPSLRAPLASGPGFAWFPIGEPGDPDPAALDAAADAVLAWLDAQPPAPVAGVLGFSQGGAMAIHLLRRAPERFAFAVALAGFVTRGAQPGDAALAAARPPVFFGRGDADRVITPAAFARTEAWLPDHADATIRVYPGLAHGISGGQLADVTAFVAARHPEDGL